MRKQSTLEKALPIVAKTISEKYEGRLNVFVGGNCACTDGCDIYLPTLPETKEARLLARGYIDHEAAHIRFTNFKLKNDSMTNALEDIRIEDKISKIFPGTKKNLKELTAWFMRQGEITVSEQDSDHDVLAKYVHFKLRDRVLGHEVSSILEPAEQELLRRFGENLKQNADRIIKQKLKSTKDASRRAQKLRALLPQNQQDEQQQGQKGQRQEDQDGQDGSGESSDQSGQGGQSDKNGQGKGQASEADQNKEQKESKENGQGRGQKSQNDESEDSEGGQGGSTQSQESGENSDGDSDGNGDGSSESGGDGAGGGNADSDQGMEATFQGLGEAVAEALTRISKPAEDSMDWMEDIQMPRAITATQEGSLHSSLREHLQDAKARSVKMRYKLQSVLEAKRRDQKRIARSGKKFSSKNLYRLAGGDTRVFSRKTESKAVNTAVHLLLDSSGSMMGPEMTVALNACYSLGLALNSMKYVNLAISNFPGSTGLREIKRFGEPLRMGPFDVYAGGGTPTAEAMLHAAYTLASQKEPRKIIFVITDGMPNRPLAVKKMQAWLKSCGVEVFGVGIKCPQVASVFEDSIVVDDLNDLAQSIFKTLGKKL